MKTVIYSLITILLLSCSGDNVSNTNTPDDNSGLSNLLDSANSEISKLGESVTEKDGLIESITQELSSRSNNIDLLNDRLEGYGVKYTVEDDVLTSVESKKQPKIFYSSSACIYPEYMQRQAENPDCREETAYPASPDSEYGWEKLFSERLYLTYNRNHGIPVRIARYHNIYGPQGTWKGGREKAPAAICRKVAELPPEGGSIEVWGDGKQTRSFLLVDECVEATYRLMQSEVIEPINIGSEEMVTINQLVDTAARVAGKTVEKNHIDGPLGVRGRNSNNDLIREKLGWDYSLTLEEGIAQTYKWIEEQIS